MPTSTKGVQETWHFSWQGVEGRTFLDQRAMPGRTRGRASQDEMKRDPWRNPSGSLHLRPRPWVSFQRGSRFCWSKRSHFCPEDIKCWAQADGGAVLSPHLQPDPTETVRAPQASTAHLLSANPRNTLVSVGGAPDAIQRRPPEQTGDE